MIKPTMLYHVIYHDIINDIYYVDRQSYEICKSNGIEIEALPRIIQNKNCYTITSKQIDELKNKLKCEINITKIILKEDKEKIKQKRQVCVFNDSKFIEEDLYNNLSKDASKRIKVDGIIYSQVNDELLKMLEDDYELDEINIVPITK